MKKTVFSIFLITLVLFGCTDDEVSPLSPVYTRDGEFHKAISTQDTISSNNSIVDDLNGLIR